MLMCLEEKGLWSMMEKMIYEAATVAAARKHLMQGGILGVLHWKEFIAANASLIRHLLIGKHSQPKIRSWQYVFLPFSSSRSWSWESVGS